MLSVGVMFDVARNIISAGLGAGGGMGRWARGIIGDWVGLGDLGRVGGGELLRGG